MCTMCMPGVLGGQEWVLDFLVREPWTSFSCHGDAGNLGPHAPNSRALSSPGNMFSYGLFDSQVLSFLLWGINC